MSHFGMISFIFNFWVVVIELHHYRRKKRTNCGHFSQRPTSIHHQMGVIEKKTISGQNDQNLVLVNTVSRSYFMCWCVQVFRLLRWSIDLLEVGRGPRNCRVLRPVFHLSTICRKRFVHLVKCATMPPHLRAPHELLLRPGKGSIWQSHGFTKMSSFAICSFCLKFLKNYLQFSICFKKIVSVALNLFFSISSSEIGKLHILIASHSQIKTYFPLKPSFRKFENMHFSQLSMVNAHVVQMPGDLGDLCVHACSSCPIRQDSILNIQLFVSNNQLFVSNIQLFVSDIQLFVSNIFKLFSNFGTLRDLLLCWATLGGVVRVRIRSRTESLRVGELVNSQLLLFQPFIGGHEDLMLWHLPTFEV